MENNSGSQKMYDIILYNHPKWSNGLSELSRSWGMGWGSAVWERGHGPSPSSTPTPPTGWGSLLRVADLYFTHKLWCLGELSLLSWHA